VLLQSVTVVTASAQSASRRAARGLQIDRFAARGVWAPRRAIPDHDSIMLNRAMAALPRTPSPDGCDPHRECRCC
jgi:hypothetical protein